jgi:hypothetical protein
LHRARALARGRERAERNEHAHQRAEDPPSSRPGPACPPCSSSVVMRPLPHAWRTCTQPRLSAETRPPSAANRRGVGLV